MRPYLIGSWLSLVAADFVSVTPLQPRDSLQSLNSHTSRHLIKRDSNYTIPLSRSFSNVILFQTDNIEIQCTECYIAGTASIGFAIDDGFNFTQVFNTIKSNVSETIKNVTEQTTGQILQVYSEQVQNFDLRNLDDIQLPTINTSFALQNISIPEVHLDFRFDGLELYMALDTILSSGNTYTLNMYASKTAVGFKINENLSVGLYASIDLILDVSTQIDISSGFHIKLDDGVSFNIALFAKEVSKMTMPGGHFEFLPVTLKSGSTTLSAILQISIHAGINLDLPTDIIKGVSMFGTGIPLPSAGLDVAVYANVAEFKTNVTYDSANKTCPLVVEESYQFAVGAQAGATVGFGDLVWGPTPETSTPVFYTTIGSACASSKPELPTSNSSSIIQPSVVKRQNVQTTTLVNTVVYTAVGCKSQGLIPCPASLQTTSKITTTTAVVTAIPSGSKVSPPGITQTAVSTIPFGKDLKSIVATSGKPVSYIPPPPPPPPPPAPSSTSSSINGTQSAGASTTKPDGDGRKTKLIVGLSLGLGIPFLAITGVVAYLMIKKRRNSYRFAPSDEDLPVVEILGPNNAYTAPAVPVAQRREF